MQQNKNNKERLDKLLCDLGYFETKNKAQAAILAGDVKINDERITKAGYQIKNVEGLKIDVAKMPFVSRGGFKLDKAIKSFHIDLKGRIGLDAGASTGGFTDCMLQNGVEKVYAVDVGYGQIAWKLRTDDRVKVIERTNIKNCEKSAVYTEGEMLADFACMDLSFISITKVLENIKALMNHKKQEIVALIKPQFEAGKDQISKKGVVRDKSVHIKVIKNVIDYACKLSLFPINLTYSPIKGPAGNIEYLIHLSNIASDFNYETIESVVDKANEQL